MFRPQMQPVRGVQPQGGPGTGSPTIGVPMAKKGGRVKRADGGRTMGKNKGHKGPVTNVIVAPGAGGGGGGAPHPVPVPIPVRRPPSPAMAGGPPPGATPPRPMPMPPGGAPIAGMGGAPMPPPGGIKRGGRARAHA